MKCQNLEGGGGVRGEAFEYQAQNSVAWKDEQD